MAKTSQINQDLDFNPNTYIFYYFDNFRRYGTRTEYTDFSDISKNRRIALMKQQLQKFKMHEASILHINDSSVQTFEELSNPSFWKDVDILADTYDVFMYGDEKLSTSYFQYANKEEAQRKADELGKHITEFSKNIEALAQRAYEKINDKGNFQQYVQEVIKEYSKTNGLTGEKNELAMHVLSALLKEDGFKKFSDSSSDAKGMLETDMNKLLLIAQALPEYETFLNTHAGEIKNKGKGSYKSNFFYTVVNKITMLRNHAKGMTHEIAVLTGALQAKGVINKALKKINIEVLGGASTGSGTGDSMLGLEWTVKEPRFSGALSKMQTDEELIETGVVNKGDDCITIQTDANGGGKVITEVGFNIKNYSTKNKVNFMTYTIHSGSEGRIRHRRTAGLHAHAVRRGLRPQESRI